MPRRTRQRHRPERVRETLTPSVTKGQIQPLNQLPQTLPLDPIYTSDVGAVNLNYEQTLGGINFDRTQLGQATGFDAAGNLDPTNPYSVAANLQRRYQQGQRAISSGYASRGMLYDSVRQTAQDEGTYQYNRSYDTARRAAQGGYQNLTEREQQAGFNRTIGLNDAAADRLSRVDPASITPEVTSIPRTAPTTVPRNIPSYRRRRRPR